MNEEQIATVKSTWSQVVPIADTAADLFYGRLFELDDSLRPMFPDDLGDQKKKLMQTLGRLVASLEDLESVVPAVQDLGKRHVGYGVKEPHYQTVGAALLWTLEKGLGDAWDPEVQQAWTAVYTLVSGVMIDAAKEVESPAAE
jgi:hemoglobin-like flavoprotein